MKLVLTVSLGIVASFAFTVLFEMLLMDSSAPLTVLHIYPEFPAITVSVGILVGLIERNRALIAGALSLLPWSVVMILGANRNHSSASRWLIATVVVAIYSAIGIGVAILTAKTVRRVSQLKVSA
jgi:hypothetical protein